MKSLNTPAERFVGKTMVFGMIALFAISFLVIMGAVVSPDPVPAIGQPIGVSTNQVSQRIAYDGTNRILYIGECLPQFQNRGGALAWRIKRITYEGATTRILTVLWATRSADYIHAWNLRATYAYD